MSNLQSIALPNNERSLAYVQAVLKHNFSPSELADLVNNIKTMQSEIRACFETLECSFGHVNDLYTFANNRLVRVATSTSIVSTSTMLTARVKLASWLKQREGTWGLSKRSRPREVKLARPDIFLSDVDIRLQDSVGSDRVSKMPSDVLSKVLHHLCSSGPFQLCSVLFVSKRLYHAAVDDASLWTAISLDVEFFGHFMWQFKKANGFIEQCLLRSGSLPLSLSIHSPNPHVDDRLLAYLQPFRDYEYRAFERCSSLELFSTYRHDMLPKEFPSLQYLSLSGFDEGKYESLFPDCPVLVRVELLNHSKPHPGFWRTSLAHVTTLSFGKSYTSTWSPFDMITLSQFPALHDLTLFSVNQDLDFLETFGLQPPVQFQYLQILRTHGNVPLWVIATVVAPALEVLHIKGGAEHATSIYELSWPSGFSCSHIYALLPKAASMRDPAWYFYLSRLVRQCTKLKTLHISKWMEVKCKRFISGSNIILHVL